MREWARERAKEREIESERERESVSLPLRGVTVLHMFPLSARVQKDLVHKLGLMRMRSETKSVLG